MIRIQNIPLPIGGGEEQLRKRAARLLGLNPGQLRSLTLARQSIDARKKSDVHYVCTVHVEVDNEARIMARCRDKNVSLHTEQPYAFPPVRRTSPLPPVVVGMGPAGLFAALFLARNRVIPIVLERGRPVEERAADVERFWATGVLDTASNVQFGEGGAGTFSDGKLNTGTHDARIGFVLAEFAAHGAPEHITYDAKPHIGTDVLVEVVQNLRREVIDRGGEVRFGHRVTGLSTEDGHIAALTVAGPAGSYTLPARQVILAIGHSARDTFEMLHAQGVPMEPKPFSMGVRIEHRQADINAAQYGAAAERLPAADYSLSCHLPDGSSAYTFCMCPGGFIVPAMTDAAESVVNGMSPSGRTSPYANSGLVTEVRLADFEHLRAEWGELAGLKFQQRFEESARQRGGEHQIAPAQRVADFVAGRASGSLPRTSYIPGITPSRLDEWMPGFIAQGLRQGIATFGRRMRGYLTNEAVVVGVESRTSTPVRVPRDPGTLMHPETKGLFPAGEGAGYAGGIISAALDGERIAEAVKNYIR